MTNPCNAPSFYGQISDIDGLTSMEDWKASSSSVDGLPETVTDLETEDGTREENVVASGHHAPQEWRRYRVTIASKISFGASSDFLPSF
ncbi:hypothetical protein U1Q18_035873 [Sarracenia purpurea var. burkii]